MPGKAKPKDDFSSVLKLDDLLKKNQLAHLPWRGRKIPGGQERSLFDLKSERSWPLFLTLRALEEEMLFEKSKPGSTLVNLGLKKLTEPQVEQIDELLGSLGDHGEVHLIVQRGILKYINRVEKHQSWETSEQD